MKPKRIAGKMNSLEQEFYDQFHKGAVWIDKWAILDVLFEPITIRLADKTTYTPDFLVITTAGFYFVETKGFWRDDAKVKIKVAAELLKLFHFVSVEKKKNELVDCWSFTKFPPLDEKEVKKLLLPCNRKR